MSTRKAKAGTKPATKTVKSAPAPATKAEVAKLKALVEALTQEVLELKAQCAAQASDKAVLLARTLVESGTLPIGTNKAIKRSGILE